MSVDVEALLRRRAEALARPIDDEVVSNTVEVLVVSVGGDRRYGIETRYAGRIIAEPRLSRLPAGCGQFMGVTAVGGQVIPAVDLASLLDFGATDPAKAFIVAVQLEADVVGLLVDGVQDIIELPGQDLLPVPEVDPGARLARFMTGDGLVLVDIHALFNDDRLVVAPGGRQPPPRTRTVDSTRE